LALLPESIYPAVLELLPDAVVIVSRAGTIEFVNAQTEALFGYERGELIDQSIEMLVPDEYRANHRAHRSGFMRRPGTRPMGLDMELWGRRKDHSLFPIEISLSPIIRGAQMYVTSVIRDLSERHQMRTELEAQTERQRIAMDLHDGTIQSIYAIGLGLELALTDVIGDPVGAGRRIDNSIQSLNGVVADIRAYIFDLRPERYSGDLMGDLSSTLDEFRGSCTIDVRAEFPSHFPVLREDRAAAMLHITREALSNVRKHAGASTITMTITRDELALTLAVHDDGGGFALETEQVETHRGLRNMKLRTQRLGGVFDVESTPGQGATVRVRMPVAS
jgi:PAS domain S-box-containing protein